MMNTNSNNKIFFILLLLIITTISLKAQDYITVSGNIRNAEEPVENAYMEFRKDSIFKIFISDLNGNFKTTPLPHGEYIISISHLSHIPLSRTYTIRESMDFLLEINTHQFGEVTVKGDINRSIRMRDGNMVLNPSFLGNLKMNSAYQIITKVPGVNVSNSGVTINGLSSGLKIDGRLTGLSASAINAYLKSIPADKIKEIVVQTSSNAENSASDVGGVVNIIMKKENENSHSMNMGGNIQYIDKSLANATSGYYAMQQNRTYLSVFLEYENEYEKNKSRYVTNYSNVGNSSGNAVNKTRGNAYFGVINFDYTFNNNHILHINSSFYYENHNKYSDKTSDYYRANKLYEVSTDQTKADDDGDLFRIYIDYKTNEALKWKHDLGYGIIWGKSNDAIANDNATETNNETYLSKIGITNRHFGFQHQFHYDLSYSANNSEIRMGAKAEVGNLTPSSRYDSIRNEQHVYNPLLSSKYKLKENLYGVYASIRYRLEPLSLYAGLRAEITDLGVKSLYDQVNWKYNKIHIFPYARISGNFDDIYTSLTFSTGIDRPSYLYYTPNYRYSDKYSYSTGNPNLLPSRFYKVGFENLLFDYLKLDLSYVFKKNNYRSITYKGENDFEEITTYMNYANEHKFIGNLYLPYVFYNDKINGHLGFYGEYSKLADYETSLKLRTKKNGGFVLSNSTDYEFSDNFVIGYYFKYQGPLYAEQISQKAFTCLDLQASYTINKFTLGLQANDIFHGNKKKGTWYYVDDTTDFHINNFTQRFGISVRYSIMKGKKIKERENKGADTSRFK